MRLEIEALTIEELKALGACGPHPELVKPLLRHLARRQYLAKNKDLSRDQVDNQIGLVPLEGERRSSERRTRRG